jgi:flagellar secretion chaperone FliS
MSFQQSYREAAVRGASPVGLVVRLYEQMIEDLRHVAIAIEKNDIRRRTQRIKHAILIVGHLQSTLDFDKGGKVARDLDDFYNTLRQSLVWVQSHPSKRGVAQLITDLLAVREAWVEVERAEKASVATATQTASSGATGPESESDHARMDWQG